MMVSIGALNSLLLASSSGGGFNLHYKLLVGSTALVVAFLVLLAFVARGQLGEVPTGWAACFEHVFDWLDDLAQDMMGAEGRKYVPLVMSMFLFVLASNWSGLLPLPVVEMGPEAHAQVGHVDEAHPELESGVDAAAADFEESVEEAGHTFRFESPTTSYNTTLMLALVSFFAFNIFGLVKQMTPRKAVSHGEDDVHHHGHPGGLAGLGTWIAHFWQPTPMLWKTLEGPLRYCLVPFLAVLFIMLNIIEELARILSLSIRLYGNIFGEHQVKHNLLVTLQAFLGSAVQGFTTGAIVPVVGWGLLSGLLWVSSLFAIFLGGLAGFIQAMIFAVLTLTYIAHAVAEEH